MSWKKILLIAVVAAGFALGSAPRSQAYGGVSVGIGIGVPVGYGYGGYGYGGYGYGGYGYRAAYAPYGYGYAPYGGYYEPGYVRVVVRPHYHWRHGHRYYCTQRHRHWR
ncbi:MAG: hypothetical protein M3032_07210 [Verrucomicrobiota bacterium]|nr:hypothetical protein [Verrucomicrobiota bacterium]